MQSYFLSQNKNALINGHQFSPFFLHILPKPNAVYVDWAPVIRRDENLKRAASLKCMDPNPNATHPRKTIETSSTTKNAPQRTQPRTSSRWNFRSP